MKYLSEQSIQSARLILKATPDALQAAYIEGWNDCIEALTKYLPQTRDEIAVSQLADNYDAIYDDEDDEEPPEHCDGCAFNDGFLRALGTRGMRESDGEE